MRIRLDVVNENYKYFRGGADIEVPSPYEECFKPVDVCDDPMMAIVSGGMPANSERLERVIALRQEAAEQMARYLTDLILDEMQKNDTKNGYKD